MNKELGSEKLNYDKEEEIDFSILFNTLLRNKKFIGVFSIISLIVFLFYGVFRKQKWVGQFEIVLSAEKESSPSDLVKSLNLDLPDGLAGVGSSSSKNLDTEVGILKSPSTLMPIFDFVNKENKIKNPNKKDLIFKKWRNRNLKFDLKKKTSILQISYKDKNKELILPVLTKISKQYQDYSGKSRKRKLELYGDFLNKQIIFFKDKSSQSLKNAQEYAIDQDLTILDAKSFTPNIPNISNKSLNSGNKNSVNMDVFNSEFTLANVGIEQVRVNAANKIKQIESQIKKLNDLDNDSDAIKYIGSTMPGVNETKIFEKLENIEVKLLEYRTRYKPTDFSIKRLEESKKQLINLLKIESIGYLKAERISAEALMESAMRPKGVLLKYKELIREAARDEATLVGLENKLRINNLDQAKVKDPWELITDPTLDNDPVGLTKSKLALLGFLVGFLISCLIVIIREKRSGLIFDEKFLESFLEAKILKRLPLRQNQFKEKINEISLLEIFKSDKTTKFIITSNIDLKKVNNFKNEIQNQGELNFNDISFSDNQNINLLKDNLDLILVTSMDKLEFQEILSFKERIRFLNTNLRGIVLI